MHATSGSDGAIDWSVSHRHFPENLFLQFLSIQTIGEPFRRWALQLVLLLCKPAGENVHLDRLLSDDLSYM
eukprot:1155955-Pelagomonas_calceolata.AAC.5